MALVPLLTPDTEPELLTTVALLEAHGIPTFVRGGGMGSLYPGPQVASYNTRTILVAEDQLTEARDLLADVERTAILDDEPDQTPMRSPGIGRMLFEFLFFGWFMPGPRTRKPASNEADAINTSQTRSHDP